MRNYLIAIAAATVVASSAQAAPGQMAGSELMPMAKISSATAPATALHARPGKITDRELEKEAGGTGLRYFFDVASHGKTYEVGVDAITGRVLENQAEGAHPD